jgi:hypothetical protein
LCFSENFLFLGILEVEKQRHHESMLAVADEPEPLSPAEQEGEPAEPPPEKDKKKGSRKSTADGGKKTDGRKSTSGGSPRKSGAKGALPAYRQH